MVAGPRMPNRKYSSCIGLNCGPLYLRQRGAGWLYSSCRIPYPDAQIGGCPRPLLFSASLAHPRTAHQGRSRSRRRSRHRIQRATLHARRSAGKGRSFLSRFGLVPPIVSCVVVGTNRSARSTSAQSRGRPPAARPAPPEYHGRAFTIPFWGSSLLDPYRNSVHVVECLGMGVVGGRGLYVFMVCVYVWICVPSLPDDDGDDEGELEWPSEGKTLGPSQLCHHYICLLPYPSSSRPIGR